jgi:hypothetical protein
MSEGVGEGVEVLDPMKALVGKCYGNWANEDPCVRCEIRVRCEEHTKKVAVSKPLPPKKEEVVDDFPKMKPIEYILSLFSNDFEMRDVSKDGVGIYTFWADDDTPMFQVRYVKKSGKFLIATPDKSSIIQLPELKSIKHALEVTRVIIESL